MSLIFQSTFPHQIGHRSSNLKVGQGEQFRKARGAMREGRKAQAALWPDYKSLPKGMR